MQRFAVGIEFSGVEYRGWQTQQTGVRSVQETIETVLSKIANEPIILHGAGRTDAGVHATNMVAHFDTSAIRPLRGWLMGANSTLPKDIAIQWIKQMDTDFHARFKAQSRRYRYVVYNSPSRPALLYKQVTHVYYPLDVDKMIEAAKKFEGTHNFESFRAASCQSNQPVRHVSHCRLIRHGCYLVLDIQADGFYIIWCATSWDVYLKSVRACMKLTILTRFLQLKTVRLQGSPRHPMAYILFKHIIQNSLIYPKHRLVHTG